MTLGTRYSNRELSNLDFGAVGVRDDLSARQLSLDLDLTLGDDVELSAVIALGKDLSTLVELPRETERAQDLEIDATELRGPEVTLQ